MSVAGFTGVMALLLLWQTAIPETGGQPDPCEEPRGYFLGQVDEEFGIPESQFADAVAEAIALWEAEAGHALFNRQRDAGLSINLIYDDRQSMINELRELEQDYHRNLQQLQGQSEQLQAEYERRHTVYDSLQQVLDDVTAEYNERVSYWNEQGGATEEAVEELEARRTRINELERKVEDQLRRVNRVVEDQNRLAARKEELTNRYNRQIERYKEDFGELHKFTQGEYKSGEDAEINIYQYEGRNDLVRVLAHEFGHVLGIEHVNDPEAVMYEVRFEAPEQPVRLTGQDRRALQRQCR